MLPRRRLPLRQLSVPGDAGLQTRGEDRVGQHDADGRLTTCRLTETFLCLRLGEALSSGVTETESADLTLCSCLRQEVY